MIEPSDERKLLARLGLLALAACCGALLSGTAAALAYTAQDPLQKFLGITLQHLRPLHETAAFAWVFLGGVTVVYLYLHESGGALGPAARRRAAWQTAIWGAAGVGISVTVLSGSFTGREYLGYHPLFSLAILAGWLLFAYNFFAREGASLRAQPVYVFMWSVAIPLFVLTYLEAHLYLLDELSRRPVRDIAMQWRSNGVLVGSFNLLAYGSLTYVVGRIRGDDSYAYSRTAFALFWVGLLNTFTNFGHHTYHLPQSPWIHQISFAVSMLEVVILTRVLLDVWGLSRQDSVTGRYGTAAAFIRAATLWTCLLLFLSLAIAVPPLNALVHGTHVIVAHSMGSMLGIDSMILWAAFAYLLCQLQCSDRACAKGRRLIPVVNASLLLFLLAFLARGAADGWTRYAGPSAPDMSHVFALFPTLMVAAGLTLAGSVLWILSSWIRVLWPLARRSA